MADQRASGWYPDQNDPNAEVYWDGTRWHGRREAMGEDEPKQPSAATPVVVAGVSNLPTRKFWVTAILLVAAVLAVVFWVIPNIRESNEKMESGYKMMHEKCLDEKRSAGMGIAQSAEECKHWID